MKIQQEHLEQFFYLARERYSIYLKRSQGLPAPWTDDPVLANWRFTNTFRELDKTTAWFREHIREPLRDKPSVVLATLAFRFFNRIEVGEVLKPWLLEDDWRLTLWEDTLQARILGQNRPLVTGAYIVKTRDGMPKLRSIIESLRWAKMHEPSILQWLRETHEEPRHAEDLWYILRGFDYVGDFTANEIIVDLYHTAVLEQAIDLRTWTNPGPGCAQGLGLLLHDDENRYNRAAKADRAEMIGLMGEFLEAARDPLYWPQDWPEWKFLHNVQFLMCEQSKYIKGQRGQRLKRRYRVHHPSA
jgi:hypothetical protein